MAAAAMSGFTVDLGALQVAAQGIQGVLDELGDLGINGEQESGSPIENVALSQEDAGSLVVAAIVADALQRAHYALRTALHNGTALVAYLRQAAAAYQGVETQVGDLFNTIHHDLTTPPVGRAGAGSVFSKLAGGVG